MGLGVALRNLFQSIFGKKKTTDGNKITKEVRQRAKALGITPEEYLKIKNYNASIWNVGDGDWGSGSGGNGKIDITDNTIEALRGNLQSKKSELGIPEDVQKPLFGVLTEAVKQYDEVQETPDAQNSAAITDAEEQYDDALDEVDNTEDEAARNNRAADNFFKQANADATQNNAAAESALNAVNQQADANNAAANGQLVQAQQESDENTGAALREQQTVEAEAQANNDAAQGEVTAAEDQRTKDVKDAEQKTSDAQTYKNSTAQAVSDIQTKLDESETNVINLEKAINNANSNVTPEMQEKLAKAKKERDELKAQLEEAQKKDQEADQKLQEAKENEERVKSEGEQKVADAKAKAEGVKADGEKDAERAADNTQRVKQQGEASVEGAQGGVAKAQSEGAQAVKKQEDKVDEVKTEGEQQVADAQKSKKKTEQQGKKDVREAESEAKKAKSAVDDVYYHSSDEYKQRSLGVVQDVSDAKVTDNAGNLARNQAMARAKQKNPNASEEEVKEAAKHELASIMKDVDARRKDGAQTPFNQPPSQEALAKAAAERYDSEVQAGHSTRTSKSKEDLLPDGDLNNKMHLQADAGNCWAQAAVTSIAATEEGSKMLSSHMYRDAARGVTSVHLQEAQNNGKGAGGSGIYTFTDKEIAEGAKHFGTGDGDITAYMLATERYLKESGANSNGSEPFASSGNTNNRMYEIITGAQTEYTGHSGYVNVGINRFLVVDDFNNKYSYGALCKAVQQGHTAGNLTVAATNGNSHSFSIVGVSENGTLLIQEPNNRGFFNEMFTFTDKNGNTVTPFKKTTSVNGRPTYECSREAYQKFIRSGTIYRWR